MDEPYVPWRNVAACAVPFTFLAHQAPLLPLKMRRPQRWDGLGLVVGSIMPDLWYITSGWLYGPAGIALWVDAHRLGVQPQYCILPGLALTMALRRWVMGIVPLAFGDLGVFRLRDYCLVATARHRWWVTLYSVAVGSVSHIFIDSFTHREGPAVQNIPALTAVIANVAGVDVTVFRFLQYVGHVLGSLAGLLLLAELGRGRWLRRWHPSGTLEFATEPDGRAITAMRSVLAVGAMTGAVYAAVRWSDGFVVGIMAFSLVMLATTFMAGWVGRRLS